MSPPRKPTTAVPLSRVFAADTRIADWAARRNEEAAVALIVRRGLPRPLADRVRVTASRGGLLELTVAAGAAAAAVRQRSPDLLAALRREGCDFTEIRIRVQVAPGAGIPQKTLSRQLDTQAAAVFDLAGRLPEGPLRDALDRWSRRARGRASR